MTFEITFCWFGSDCASFAKRAYDYGQHFHFCHKMKHKPADKTLEQRFFEEFRPHVKTPVNLNNLNIEDCVNCFVLATFLLYYIVVFVVHSTCRSTSVLAMFFQPTYQIKVSTCTVCTCTCM